MLLYTCYSCQRGNHSDCAGKRPPPPGVLGGTECDCDGTCASRATTDPQVERIAEAVERAGGLVCEEHGCEWPHGECAGPGMTKAAWDDQHGAT